MRIARWTWATLPILGLVAACAPTPDPAREEPPALESSLSGPPFVDVTEASGIDFVHINGATSRRYLPETMGAGVALFDFDFDGHLDVYLVNGQAVGAAQAPPGRLFRNLGGGAFEDATDRAGLDLGLNGMGTAVGDVDADGDQDLFVSGIDRALFFRNRGDGSFDEVAAAVGLEQPGFGTSAAFVDVDQDGDLDLFVGRYVLWSQEGDVRCRPDGEHFSYCTPEVYEGVDSLLFRNRGDGTFEDASREAGIAGHPGKALGVVPLDANDDGWPDLVVANDTAPNFLFLNRGDGRFDERGLERGLALGPSGSPRGSMGIDAGDLNGNGRADVVVANFAQEMSALYRASVQGQYLDEGPGMGLGLPSLMTLAFGVLATDYDGDGWLDIFLLNGHIEPEIATFQPLQSYEQSPALLRNRGPGEGFELVPASGALAAPLVGRGLAEGDLDGDLDPDLVATQNGRSVRVLRSETSGTHRLVIRPVAQASSPGGYGLEVEVQLAERSTRRRLASGRSYLSANEAKLVIGLGDSSTVERLETRWPSGARQVFRRPAVDRLLVLFESSPLAARGRSQAQARASQFSPDRGGESEEYW